MKLILIMFVRLNIALLLSVLFEQCFFFLFLFFLQQTQGRRALKQCWLQSVKNMSIEKEEKHRNRIYLTNINKVTFRG